MSGLSTEALLRKGERILRNNDANISRNKAKTAAIKSERKNPRKISLGPNRKRGQRLSLSPGGDHDAN